MTNDEALNVLRMLLAVGEADLEMLNDLEEALEVLENAVEKAWMYDELNK